MSHSSVRTAFGLLIAAQAAHSIEEYLGRLWEVFPPATFVSGLVSPNRDVGFIKLRPRAWRRRRSFSLSCSIWSGNR